MRDLIEALTILLKYGDPRNPTSCEHDVLTICGIDPADVSAGDIVALEALGFFIDDDGYDDAQFQSFRFGSA